MSNFVYRGPLSPESPLFRGRTTELARLQQLCSSEVRAYATVYGGRQTGKTSLLLRLAAQLPPPVQTCRVDFQGLPGASTPQVYAYLAERIARALPHASPPSNVDNPPGLIDFLCQALNLPELEQFVLLLEELGALPQTSREDLANVLRSLFTNRFDHDCRPLAKMMVVLAGSIELYDLSVTQVSTLHNICEAVYLPDLSEGEAVGLVIDGLTGLDLPYTEAEIFGRAIYDQVGGHPYLTQRLGAALETALTTGETLALKDVDNEVENLLQGDPLLRNLRRGLAEQDLFAAVPDLLNGQIRFSRLDEEMARLELLGLAGERDGYWVGRNPFLARALQSWLVTEPPLMPANHLPRPVEVGEPTVVCPDSSRGEQPISCEKEKTDMQPTVFISYSQADELEKEQLLSHLGVLQNAKLIDVWSEDRIAAGADWETEIDQAIAQARVAVLLISASFLSTDFIVNQTIPTLLQRRKDEGLVVFPVIAKACAWQKVDWLAKMSGRPRNRRPVWSDGGSHADEDLATIAEEIATIVSQARPISLAQPSHPETSEASVTPPQAEQPKPIHKPKRFNTAKIRRLLNTSFDDPGLDAFCQDYFPTVFDRFGRGQRKDEKITLLLDHCRRAQNGFKLLLDAVRSECEADASRQEELEPLLIELERVVE